MTLTRANILERMSTADELLSRGATYSAVAEWGELWGATGLDGELREELGEMIEARLPRIDLKAVLRELDKRIARMRRILSVGTRFCHEEIALVLSIRFDVESIVNLLAAFCPEAGVTRSVDDCDEELREIARRPKNKRDYASAVAMVESTSLRELPRHLVLPT